MNHDALVQLRIAADGPAEGQPLERWGFRFYSDSQMWRKIGTRERRMPVNVRRSVVARDVDVPEEVIAAWENATSRVAESDATDVRELLKVEGGRPRCKDPLRDWNFQFFPASRTWRRARASRNEVSRAEVSRKTGVPEEVLLHWERAMETWSDSEVA